jgi:hypothetical protein
MSDTSTSIVPSIADYPDREQKARLIIDWLVNINAIKADKTDCILSSESGYPIDIGSKKLTYESEYLPFDLITNGLEVITTRTVFHSGENGIDTFICPLCNEDILSDAWAFFDDFYNNGNSTPTCPICKKRSALNDYLIEPAWGFSNLGFTFWNWPDFKEEVIKEFEQRLGCKVKVVSARI